MKEARRMTTGVHKGEVEHKYDYSAVLAETPAYGWSSSEKHLGLWLVNPSTEYLGGGPTKAELTGHLDVNAGGLPTLLNMWLGSHYGGTVLQVAPGEAWTKVVGPFLIYCNAASSHEALWRDALAQAAKETAAWPYFWAADHPDFPPRPQRGTVNGQLILHDPLAPESQMSNVWVGVSAPDYAASVPAAMACRHWWTGSATQSFTSSGRVRTIMAGLPFRMSAPGITRCTPLPTGCWASLRNNVALTAGQALALGELTWTPGAVRSPGLANRRAGPHGAGIPPRRRLLALGTLL